jgi:flagellar hook-associated protein 1 FlgK
MSSSLLSIGRTALVVQQTALQTLSQNIANAETPGYSRQEAVLTASTPLRMPYGNVGTGVSLSVIQRKRDVLLDDGYRSANGLAGETATRSTLLGQLESVFGEPADAGMAAALDQFWGAWSDLASSPTNGAAQSVVQSRGRQLAQRFNEYDAQLTQLRGSNLDRTASTVNQINSLATQIADLNARIVGTEGGNNPANDLRDLRDQRIDELSKLANTRVFPSTTNGSVQVVIGNATLVDGASARTLSVKIPSESPPPATPNLDLPVKLYLGNSPDALTNFGGELGATIDVLNEDIPDMRGRLDALASNIVREVNTVHSGGYVFAGNAIPGTSAGNFFAPGSVGSPVTAATMSLRDVINSDARNIAVSSDPAAPTGNGVAQNIASLRITSPTISYTSSSGITETGSFFSFFQKSVTQLGIDVRAAGDNAEVYASLQEQADARRQSVSGVNVDEELVQMVRLQQSYTAATKLIKTADEIMQTLLQLI